MSIKKEQNINKLSCLQNVQFQESTSLIKKLLEDQGLLNKKETNESDQDENTKYELELKSFLTIFEIPFYYYSWIPTAVHTGVFNTEAIIKDLLKIQKEFEQKETNPAYLKLDRLKNIYKIENNQLINVIKDVLFEVYKGSYQVFELPYIFNLIQRVNLLTDDGYKISDDIISCFKLGIDKSKIISSYEERFSYKSRIDEGMKNKDLLEIFNYAKNINESFIDEIERSILDKFMSALKPYNSEEIKNVIVNEKASVYAFFHHADPNTFYQDYISLLNKDKDDFCKSFLGLGEKYQNKHSEFTKEKHFYTKLKQLLDNTTEVGIAKLNCQYFSQYVGVILEKID